MTNEEINALAERFTDLTLQMRKLHAELESHINKSTATNDNDDNVIDITELLNGRT
jgi:hypothetical protein